MQSEFYTKLDRRDAEVTASRCTCSIPSACGRSSRPTIFNGRHNGHGRCAARCDRGRVGEALRAQRRAVEHPSFHVVGTIFDRVWFEGNPDNQWRGAQTVLLGSSNGAIVEFIVPEEGEYVMVDHHFANASQGAIGLIRAGTAAGVPEHHNIPATATPTDPAAVRGKLASKASASPAIR